MQKDIDKKEEMLREHGFYFNHNRRFWHNRSLKKVFSEVYVDDHDEGCLIKNIKEAKKYLGEWQWYCNKEPSEEEKRDILKSITPVSQ